MTPAERQAQSRSWYRAHGICTVCGQEKAHQGHTKCLNCLDRQKIYNERYLAKQPPSWKKSYNKKKRDIEKARYAARKAAGLCVSCGRKAQGGKARCTECLIRFRRYREKYNRKKGLLPVQLLGDGEHCSTCGQPVKTGFKVCETCFRNCIAMGEKGRAGVDHKNHIWHRM